MGSRFQNRRDAGRRLACELTRYAGRTDVIVLALPRGGVPVAWEVARALRAPLDVYVVRKLGSPGNEELAMGAIASGGVRVLNDDVVNLLGVRADVIERVAHQELRELERRERLYRGDRPPVQVTGRTVVLVDDGLATGSTMKAAVLALRRQAPARIVAAVPVASRPALDEVRALVDEVVCALTPEAFYAVGLWYEDFSQTTDQEVQRLLQPPQTRVAGEADDASLLQLITENARPLRRAEEDYDGLLDKIRDTDADIVLLGEATHGTHEFYAERARITQRLIGEAGFTVVAVEADWPDAWRVNQFVRGRGADVDTIDALADFRRFPAWMWRNADVLDFVGWLRSWNDRAVATQPPVGFYGLDLYSLHSSVDAVLAYLDRVDPEAGRRARVSYACLHQFGTDPQRYGHAAVLGLAQGCEDEVIRQLVELRRARDRYLVGAGPLGVEDYFYAEQNAHLAANAERYYRAVFRGRVSSWNLRDTHMVDTLDALLDHVSRTQGRPARAVVWAHNSHVGDGRHTEFGGRGQVNIGQLVRERHPGRMVNVGFTTSTGTVTAASDWGGMAERKVVRPPLAGSYEDLFCRVPLAAWILELTGGEVHEALRHPRIQRAIGVLYRPETERQSHYFRARIAEQFDFVVHLDQTRAVEPLEGAAPLPTEEVPETFPEGV